MQRGEADDDDAALVAAASSGSPLLANLVDAATEAKALRQQAEAAEVAVVQQVKNTRFERMNQKEEELRLWQEAEARKAAQQAEMERLAREMEETPYPLDAVTC